MVLPAISKSVRNTSRSMYMTDTLDTYILSISHTSYYIPGRMLYTGAALPGCSQFLQVRHIGAKCISSRVFLAFLMFLVFHQDF